MKKSTFSITKMDCPSEESLIRAKLSDFPDISFDFNIPERRLVVYHLNDIEPIARAISELSLNSSLISTESTEGAVGRGHEDERRLLLTVLLINLGFFMLEIIAGFLADSMGLVADSLDMLADAFVYGLGLYAVGKLNRSKRRVAKISGYLQLTLAILGMVEILRRFFGYEETPGFRTMVAVSLLALAGNAACMVLLQRSKSDEAHIQAGRIFTSNDVLANIGVILAGAGVYLTGSKIPDLLIGSIVFILVLRGAIRILKL